ncbi:phosphate propanoyltransferase [Megasphaera cerevisiae]|nr:phosphate propanoyltransferase [Megasphaera cerevisiae]
MVTLLMDAVKEHNMRLQSGAIPVGVSNRHVHLSEYDLFALFGTGYMLTKTKDISQPGQFACKETVTLAGPHGAIEKVRVLGPVRKESQVEILRADCFKLGIKAPLKMSGDLDGTPGITLVGPERSIYLPRGVIIAKRHIHMLPEDAQQFGVVDGQVVSVQAGGPRGGWLGNVVIRVTLTSALECHIDTEEANAMNLDNSSKITIGK